MTDFDPSTHPHRRLNPLTNEYILVSPHRTKRPWLGQTEPPQPVNLPEYDPQCYLCPGNARSGGQRNELYDHTMSFVNDFSAVLPPPGPIAPIAPHPLLTAEPVQGICDVLIYHPRHDLTFARLSLKDIARVIDSWIDAYTRRGPQEGIKYVQILENKGSMMGCSNPHPHGQIWSTSVVPSIPATELSSLRSYASSNVAPSDAPKSPGGRPCLLCEYVHFELSVPDSESRIVTKNEHWVALVPWWASWPFEILLLPHHRHVASIYHLSSEEKESFARILSNVARRYDNLFSCSFAYSMGIHQRPVPPVATDLPENEDEDNVAHLHLHFDPPLLRSATVKKFFAGYELMAEVQRDLSPEEAAKRLKDCSEAHYLDTHTPSG